MCRSSPYVKSTRSSPRTLRTLVPTAIRFSAGGPAEGGGGQDPFSWAASRYDPVMSQPHPRPVQEFFVENMDCASCALTVKGALQSVNGVSDVEVNFTTQRLRLLLDEELVSRETVERNLRDLGYPTSAPTYRVPAAQPEPAGGPAP